MENTTSFVLGLLVLLMAVASLFIPYIRIGYFGFLLFLGIIINLQAGLLIMLGGIFNSKNVSGAGFGIGLAAWGLMILGSIMGVIKTSTLASDYMLESIVWLIVAIEKGNPLYFVLFVIPSINTVNSYQTGVILFVVHLSMGAGSLILGSISFGKVGSLGI